jgi:hypothetical protein
MGCRVTKEIIMDVNTGREVIVLAIKVVGGALIIGLLLSPWLRNTKHKDNAVAYMCIWATVSGFLFLGAVISFLMETDGGSPAASTDAELLLRIIVIDFGVAAVYAVYACIVWFTRPRMQEETAQTPTTATLPEHS